MPRRIRISRLQNLSLTADSEVFSWAGNNASFFKTTTRVMQTLKGTFSWAGFNVNLTKQSFRLQTTAGSFGITGPARDFTYTPSSSLGWVGNVMPITIQQGGFFDFSTRITGNQALIGAITPTLSSTGTVVTPLPTGVSITNSPTWRLVASQSATLGTTANESFEIIQTATQLSIASFGAVTGTTVDNINAIHNCIAHAKLIGASVLIPAGTWAYSGNINLNGVAMTGVGDTSILYALNPALEAIMMTGTNPSVRSMFLSGVTPPSRSSDRHANRIVAEGCTGFTVDSVLIQSSSAVGIMSFGGSQGTISNNRISGTLADGIHMTFGSNNITVSGNTITNCADDGVATVSYVGDGVICSNITARNNVISNYTGGRGMSVVGGQDVLYEQNTISNLTTNAGRKAGILIAQEASFHTYGCTRITVQFNTVTNCGDTVANGHTGIFVNDANELPNTTIRITRNDVIQTQSGQGGIRVDNGQNVDVILDQNRITVVAGATQVYNQSIPAATVNPYVSGPVGVTGVTADSDFLARSTAAGVFRVHNWTNASLGGGFGAEFGNLTQGANPAPVIDAATKPFGNGSLRFNVTPILGGSMWWTNMATDLSLQFGSAAGGETVYFQFPYMVSAEIPPTYAAKIFLFGTGDTTGVFRSSCTDLEIELNSQIFGQKFLAAYNACPGSCGANSVFTFFPGAANPGGQQFLVANEWLTITCGITLGPRETHAGHDWFVNSNVKMWIQRGTAARTLLYDVTLGPAGTPGWTPSSSPPIWGLCAAHTTGDTQRYGKLWLLPYNQELTGSNQQPGTIWYGPLIMSTQPIAARLA